MKLSLKKYLFSAVSLSFFKIIFIYLAVLVVSCSVDFSLVAESRATLIVVHGLLIAMVSLVLECRL